MQLDKVLEHEQPLVDRESIDKERAIVSQKHLSQSSSSSQTLGYLPHEETAHMHSTDPVTKGVHAETTNIPLGHTMTRVR